MKILLTGSEGFIGKNLYEALSEKHTVSQIDKVPSFNGLNLDLAGVVEKEDYKRILDVWMEDIDLVIHCAGHADVRKSHIELDLQFRDNVMSTKAILDSMVRTGVKNIIFLSTAVTNCSGGKYLSPFTGEFTINLTKEEDYNDPVSIYGTTKLMAEHLVQGYVKNFNMRAYTLRLENIVGKYYSHGILIDLIDKLKMDKKHLEVLGNGEQTKSYLSVEELVKIICLTTKLIKISELGKNKIVNIGNVDFIKVKDIAEIICQEMNLSPKITYGDSEIGFKGDIANIGMSKGKMLSIFYRPNVSSEMAIRQTVRWILNGRINS